MAADAADATPAPGAALAPRAPADSGAALSADQARTWTRIAALLELLPSALDSRLTAATGFTRFEFSVLDALAAAPNERLRLSDLAAATNATLPRLSRVVTRLEQDGVVARVSCESDGRAVNATLTAAGRSRFEAGRGDHVAAIRDLLLSALDEDEVHALGDITAKALGAIDTEGRFVVTRACETGGAEH